MLPFLYSIASVFDTSKKTFYKPPCVINNKAEIPEEFRELYIDAAKFLFNEIKLALSAMPNVMARLLLSFIYGEGNDMGLREDNDGPMALFSSARTTTRKLCACTLRTCTKGLIRMCSLP